MRVAMVVIMATLMLSTVAHAQEDKKNLCFWMGDGCRVSVHPCTGQEGDRPFSEVMAAREACWEAIRKRRELDSQKQ
jgi:hypothetical protein